MSSATNRWTCLLLCDPKPSALNQRAISLGQIFPRESKNSMNLKDTPANCPFPSSDLVYQNEMAKMELYRRGFHSKQSGSMEGSREESALRAHSCTYSNNIQSLIRLVTEIQEHTQRLKCLKAAPVII